MNYLRKSLTSSAKGVASGELPHASEELGETTAEEGHTNDDVGGLDATSMDIVKGQNQRRGREREEATVQQKDVSF